MIRYLLLMVFTMATISFDAHAENLQPKKVNEHKSMQAEQIVRIADIVVYPEYLDEFLQAATENAKISLKEEAGVVCLFPCQLKEDETHFRVVEVYASKEAYQHHIQTQHFIRYKQKTEKMVKWLKLNDLNPLFIEDMNVIFKRMAK